MVPGFQLKETMWRKLRNPLLSDTAEICEHQIILLFS